MSHMCKNANYELNYSFKISSLEYLKQALKIFKLKEKLVAVIYKRSKTSYSLFKCWVVGASPIIYSRDAP